MKTASQRRVGVSAILQLIFLQAFVFPRYVRSEAAVAILLQRASDSRRVYAHMVHARANTDGNKGEGVTFPSGAVQRQLLEEVYHHAGVSPLDVSYVEAHGTGTKVSLLLSWIALHLQSYYIGMMEYHYITSE